MLTFKVLTNNVFNCRPLLILTKIKIVEPHYAYARPVTTKSQLSRFRELLNNNTTNTDDPRSIGNVD